MSKKSFLHLGAFLLILFFVFRNLFFNLSASLLDWRDYALVVWIMFQNTTHILSLDFVNFFETNAFYPHKLSLLFADTFLPQALISLPFFILTKNLILSFNITFFITFILNYIALFLFWKQIFKKDLIAFFGSIFIIFSPFFYMELSHFQMMSYWPFFFALYFLFRYETKKGTRNLILTGLFTTIQFLASVYLSVYLIFSILMFYALQLFSKKRFKPVLSRISIILFVFILSAGVFIKGYIDMKNTYNIKRDVKEYINYSANLSDYIFTSKINSFIHQSKIMQIWNKSDKNVGAHSSFPGFLIFTLGIFAIFRLSGNKQITSISIDLSREKAFFLILLISGLLFSLGPRLKFNGNYAHIPLPFSAVLKFVPITDATRAPVRWSFLFFLGFIYFSLISLNKLEQKSHGKIILSLIFLIFILEYIPTNLKSVKSSYINNDYQILKDICTDNKKVLLELPVTHLNAYPNILEGLEYITKTMLASTYHKCNIVNGYSGYDLPENFILSDILSKYIEEGNFKAFIKEVQKRKIDMVKFNQYYFIKELKLPAYQFINSIATESAVEKINENLFYIKRD